MSWWSWAIIVYAGVFAMLTLTIAFTCVAVRLSARLQSHRLVSEAQQFLAEAALAVGSV